MHTPPGSLQMPQLALQHSIPAGHTVGPQVTASSGTQPHTNGELSQRYPSMHSPMALHWQAPGQLFLPRPGSQASVGSSTHVPAPGQVEQLLLPQAGPNGMHCAVPLDSSQRVHCGQSTAAQETGGSGEAVSGSPACEVNIGECELSAAA
jgi:hypothetical protein